MRVPVMSAPAELAFHAPLARPAQTRRDSARLWPDLDEASPRADNLEACRFDTRAEAADAGREISRNQRTEFVIHRKDGAIQRKDCHGNDPRHIPG